MLNLLYQGKTKDVYARPDGNYEFHFKDDATGYEVDGKPVFNSGYDKVVGQILVRAQFRANLQSISTDYLNRKAYLQILLA